MGAGSRTAGGVVSLFRVPAGADAVITSQVLAPGRSLRTRVQVNDAVLVFWNVLNFGVTAAEVQHVARVTVSWARARTTWLHRHSACSRLPGSDLVQGSGDRIC